jgi:PAS domain S-box-containing protein/putative nucleotidyltransferase with HDIG domain
MRNQAPKKDLKTKGLLKCREMLKCGEKECPAYNSKSFKCWLIPGTRCNHKIQGDFMEKIEICFGCKVFKSGVTPASMNIMLGEANKQFKKYREIVKERDEELENIGLELAISLSEVFEALKRIACGDPSVKISETSKVELIAKLKHMVNITAVEINEIVEQCHEFAICLAEHFDVFHRVTKGDLNARVSGGSSIELLELMKKSINTTIESISREIFERKKAEEELRISEEKYRAIFENTGAPTIIIEEDTTISLANTEFERFAGCEKGEIEGKKSWLEFILTDDLKRVKGYHHLRLNNPDSVPNSYDFRFVNKRGNVKETIAVVSMIPGTKKRVASFLEITVRKHREMEAIVTMTTALRSASSRSEIVPLVIEQLLDLLKADGASLAMIDPVSRETVIEIGRGSWANWTGLRLTPGEGISGHVIETGQCYLNNDVQSKMRFARPELIGNLRAVACVPLIAQKHTIGAIWLGRKSDIADYEVRLLTAIAEIAANTIHRATLNERTEQQLQRLAALHGIDMAITSSLDLRVTLNVLLDQVVTQLRVDAATVLLLNKYTKTLEYAVGRGFKSFAIQKTRLRLGEGHAGQAALERRIVSIPNVLKTEDPCSRAQILSGDLFIAHHAAPLIAKGQVKGVLEVFHRSQLTPDPEWLEFFEALAAQAAIAIDNATLFDELQRSNVEISLAYDSTLEGWSHALDMRDKDTEGHTIRVAEMSIRLARSMGISESELLHIRRGALLHDIGKMGIPDAILLKSGPLTSEDFAVMKQHPVHAYKMLSPISFLRQSLNIPYCHHEKWDGTGYPNSLKSEKIPVEARIFAVVDVWDALISDRPYRKAWPEEKALEYIRKQSGRHFDPGVVEAFLKMIS